MRSGELESAPPQPSPPVTRCPLTNHQRALELERPEALVGRLLDRHLRLLVDAQHREPPVALDVHRVPHVVVQRVRRRLLQRLDAVADVEPEVDAVADCRQGAPSPRSQKPTDRAQSVRKSIDGLAKRIDVSTVRSSNRVAIGRFSIQIIAHVT